MSYLPALLAFATIHLVAAISPGPAFVTITRISLGQSRRAALGTALGLASAAFLWAILASLGMAVLLTEAAWVYRLLKLIGGLYLAWLGIQAWRHAGAPMAKPSEAPKALNLARAWRIGFATNVANPKVIVFFGSIFVMVFAPTTPVRVWLAALAIVAVNETGWFSLVALVFSTRPIQAFFARAKAWIERIAGTAMILFGLRLIADARS